MIKKILKIFWSFQRYFNRDFHRKKRHTERRSVEVNIMEIQEQYIEQDLDDQQVNHTQSTINKNRKSDQSSTSSVTMFLDSIGKKIYIIIIE
jgi:transcriptional regulator of acetoin/glycerol metabolism